MPNILSLAVDSAEETQRWAAVNTSSKSNPEPEPSAIQNPAKDTENPSKERKRPSSNDGYQLRKFARRSAAPSSPSTPTPRAQRTDIETTSPESPAWRLFLDQVLITSQKDTQTLSPPMAALDKGKGKAKEPLEDPETPKEDTETPKKDPKTLKKLETPKKVVIKGKAPKKETPKKKLMKV